MATDKSDPRRFPLVVDRQLQIASGVNPPEQYSLSGACITVENRGTHYAFGDTKSPKSPQILVSRRDFQILGDEARVGELTKQAILEHPITLPTIEIAVDPGNAEFPITVSSGELAGTDERVELHFNEAELASFSTSLERGDFGDVLVSSSATTNLV